MSSVQCGCGNWISTQFAAPDGSVRCSHCGSVVSTVPAGQQLSAAPYGGQANYGGPPQVYSGPRDENTPAIVGFVFSIISLLGCLVLAPVGALISYFGLKKENNRGLAIAGLVIGLIQSLALVAVIAYVLFVMFAVGSMAVATTAALSQAASNAAQMSNENQTRQVLELAVEVIRMAEQTDGQLPDETESAALLAGYEDAWEQQLIFQPNSNGGRVVSIGPDGTFGTSDDMSLDIRARSTPANPRSSRQAEIDAMSLEEALAGIQSNDSELQDRSASRLRSIEIDESKRTEVVTVLLSRMQFPAERQGVMTLIERWAAKEQVGLLVNYLQQPHEEGNERWTTKAAVHIRKLECYAELVPFCNHESSQLRTVARQAVSGETEFVIPVIEQCVTDLENESRREAAVELLAKQAVPEPKPEDLHQRVCERINPLIGDGNLSVQRHVETVLKKWGALDVNIPSLLEADKLELLPDSHDTRILEHLETMLVDWPLPFNAAAAKLREIGPAGEATVWPRLADERNFVVISAIQLLGDMGSERSIPKLEPLLDELSYKFQAQQAIDKIRAAGREPEDW